MADQTVRIDLITRYQGHGLGQAATDLRGLGAATQKSANEAQSGMHRLGMASQTAGTAILLGVGAALAVSAKAAIDFESQFAGVRKTVDASEPQFARLATTLRDMALDIPIPVGDLTRIAELGGQLGIPIENMEEFTETIAKLGVTTALGTEEAATNLARFANVMGTSLTKFDNLGSAIVDLGNNFATTEPEILNFGLRLAGIGSTIGLTEADVLGLATAFTALGEPAERGATAIQRTFVEMQKAVEQGGEDLALFAEIAGMASDEFVRLFQTDPAQAFIAFEKGLNRIIEQGGSVTQVLDDLGLGSQRTLGLLLKGAAGWETVADAVEMASDAYQANIALDEEAEKRFETTASQITLMANSFRDLTISLGESTTGFINFSVGAMGEFFTLIKENQAILDAFLIAIGTLAAGKLLTKMSTAFVAVATGIKSLGAASAASMTKLEKLKTIVGTLGAGLTATIAIFAAVGLAVAANRREMALYMDRVEDTTDAVQAWREGLLEIDDVVDVLNEQLKQKRAIFDITIDLEDYREFVLDEFGVPLTTMIEMAIFDFSRFEDVVNGVLKSYTDAADEITQRTIATPGAVTTDADIAMMEELKVKHHELALFIQEVTVATNEEREAAALRRKEFEAELMLANEGRSLIDTWDRYGRAAFDAGRSLTSGMLVTAEEYEQILEDIEKDTGDFVSDFLGDWQDLVGGFNEQLFNWGDSWDEYETVVSVSTEAFTASVTRWVTDQKRLSSALLFVAENFSTEAMNLWLDLDEGTQRVLAAALAESPAKFMAQFGALLAANETLLLDSFANMVATAKAGGENLVGATMDFFRDVVVPAAQAAGTEGSVEFFEVLGTGLSQADVVMANMSPEVAAAFQTFIHDTMRELDVNGISIDIVRRITADMTLTERIQYFRDAGLEWHEAAWFGYLSLNFPELLDEYIKKNAKPSPIQKKEFEYAGITYGQERNRGLDSVPLPDPDTTGLDELDDKFYQIGLGWKNSIVSSWDGLAGELQDKAVQAANKVNEAASDTWEMSSPSRVWMRFGEMVGEGFNIGLAKTLSHPTEMILANIVPDLSQMPKIDPSVQALENLAREMKAGTRPSSDTNVIFNGDVANEGEVMRKVQRGVALAGLTQIAETAPGRS